MSPRPRTPPPSRWRRARAAGSRTACARAARGPAMATAIARTMPTCRSVPATSFGSQAARSSSGDCGNPAPDSPRWPCSASLTSSTPRKFMSSVTSTSCTRRVRRMRAASPPTPRRPARPASADEQRRARSPAPRASVSATHGGGQTAERDLPFPADVDDTRARKHSATPAAVSRYGVALLRAHRDAVRRAERSLAERAVRDERVLAGAEHEGGRQAEGEGDAASARPRRRSTTRPSSAGSVASRVPPSRVGRRRARRVRRLGERARHHEPEAGEVRLVTSHDAHQPPAVHDPDAVGDAMTSSSSVEM